MRWSGVIVIFFVLFHLADLTWARAEGTVRNLTDRQPPLISIAIEHSASAWAVLEKARLWTVNILEANQESLSRRFAAATPDRFDGVGWQRGADGSLMFDGALAQIVCERWGSMEAGDHTILLGLVVGGKAADHGRPLLYYRGGYTEPDQL